MLTIKISDSVTLTASEGTIFNLVDEIKDITAWCEAVDALRDYIARCVAEL